MLIQTCTVACAKAPAVGQTKTGCITNTSPFLFDPIPALWRPSIPSFEVRMVYTLSDFYERRRIDRVSSAAILGRAYFENQHADIHICV